MSRLVPFLCCLVLLAVVLAAGCTTIPGGTVTPAPTAPTIPSTVTTPSTCGFTSCHGTDLICGMNAPQICTMEYQVGDRCRQYARCDTTNGGCMLVVTSPRFENCKACADDCLIKSGPDNLAALTCEENC